MTMQRRQSGFSAIIVVMILVLMVAFGTYMLSMTSSSAAGALNTWRGKQTGFMARSALDWAVYRVRTDKSCGTAASSFSSDGYQIMVTCSATPIYEGDTAGDDDLTADYQIFSLNVTASFGSQGGIDFAQRTVAAQVPAQ